MAENRIQDWIRYVQENSENLNDETAQPSTEGSSAERPSAERPSRRAASVEAHAAPKSTASREKPDEMMATPLVPSAVVPSAVTSVTARETAGRKAKSSATSITRQSSTRNAGERAQRVRLRPETRAQMLARLTNPMISLYEASVILGVCSATVRRYCDLGTLPHLRTPGGQRRFRLREVLALARTLEMKKRKR